jgi:hypothetical protein
MDGLDCSGSAYRQVTDSLNAVINPRIPYNAENFLPTERILSFEEGLCIVEFNVNVCCQTLYICVTLFYYNLFQISAVYYVIKYCF